MLLAPVVHPRVKHFDIQLARELSLIEREHSQNVSLYQQLENSIRQTTVPLARKNRHKLCISFNDIYNKQTEAIDYHQIFMRESHLSDAKRRCSVDPCGGASRPPTSKVSSHDAARQGSSRIQRLPPIIKLDLSNRQRRKSKHLHWMANYQQSNLETGAFQLHSDESFSPKLAPLQREVRSFLATLPTYKGVQQGFDSFAASSVYSHRTSTGGVR